MFAICVAELAEIVPIDFVFDNERFDINRWLNERFRLYRKPTSVGDVQRGVNDLNGSSFV